MNVLHVVGSIVLDIVRENGSLVGHDVGLGGVCLNAAVAARREVDRVQFTTMSYRGNAHELVQLYLADKGIDWRPLQALASVPLFGATVGDGDYVQQSFEGGAAFQLLDPELVVLDASPGDSLLTCTSLSIAQLDPLLDAFGTSFLLVSSPSTAPRLSELATGPDFVGLNRAELERTVGEPLTTWANIARAGAELVSPGGFALVTLSADGALLASRAGRHYVHQPTRKDLPRREHWLGAGDMLFGSFAGAVCNGAELEAALARGIAATTCVSARGSAPTYISDAEVDEVMSESSGWVPFS